MEARAQKRRKRTVADSRYADKYDAAEVDLEAIDVDEADPDFAYTDSGVKVEPFNMTREMETGKFDGSGNYVETRRDVAEVRDAWLDEVDSGASWTAIKGESSQIATRKRLETVSTQQLEDDAVNASLDSNKLKEELVSFLLPAESVSAALRRLGALVPKHTKKRQRKPPADEHTESTEDAAVSTAATVATVVNEEEKRFNRLTEICDLLLGNGFTDVYSATKESIVLQLANRAAPVVRWQYRLEGDPTTYGPFTTAEMARWQSQGYFAADPPTLVQEVVPSLPPSSAPATGITSKGTSDSDIWHDASSIDFALYDLQ
eukprot:GILJ01006823.1.p1 GENE.GILJ01006823.1~~GILJ01006823.1.p1  ORF type:complete len:331 (-),score=72.64 GILJ01006823.1:186-1139(-)